MLTTFIVVINLQYIDVYQIMLSTFSLHNVTCQLYFNKFGKKNKIRADINIELDI